MPGGHWYDSVKPGDLVIPDPLWNRKEKRLSRKIASPTSVIATDRVCGAHPEIMICVMSLYNTKLWLSAGWFRPHETAQETAQT